MKHINTVKEVRKYNDKYTWVETGGMIFCEDIIYL